MKTTKMICKSTKKVFLTMFVAMLCMSSQAQEKGDFAVGVQTGFKMTDVGFLKEKAHLNQLGIGAFAQYSLSDHWRMELDGNYHPMKDHMSDFTVGLNAQYVFNLSDNFKIYPLIGYAVAFGHSETYTEDRVTIEGDNDTDGGIELGVGLQYNLNDKWFIKGDYKYMPGIFGDVHVVTAGIGIRF